MSFMQHTEKNTLSIVYFLTSWLGSPHKDSEFYSFLKYLKLSFTES